MAVHVIDEQNRRGAGSVSGRHVVHAVADHDEAAGAVFQAPLRGDVQDAGRVGLRRLELARDYGPEDVAGEEVC